MVLVAKARKQKTHSPTSLLPTPRWKAYLLSAINVDI